MAMTKKLVVPRRIRALFALNNLSDRLRSDVIRDAATVELWEIPTKKTMSLTSGLSIQWLNLFAIFRAAADGAPIPPALTDQDIQIPAKASIDSEGAGLLEIERQRFRFNHAILMTSSVEKRLVAMERILASTTLTTQLQAELRRIVGKDGFSADDFFQVAEALASSPDEFAARLSEKAQTRKVALSDVLPSDHRHWENITAQLNSSISLTEFISGELARERKDRISKDPVFAFRSIALTFSSPGLVSLELFGTLDIAVKKLILDQAALLEDHFSLVGAFELCCAWVVENDEFVEAGERLLDTLFADMRKLEVACGIFGAAFILSVAKIAEDDELNTRPAFWRRLAAASHALLVVRSCGVTEIDHNGLIEWAPDQSGRAYFLSLMCDFRTDPQWRPEWIDPKFLLADVCGRAVGAFLRIPVDKAPPSWKSRIDKLRSWIGENHYDLLMTFPAVMEGARRTAFPRIGDMKELADAYRQIIDIPTVEHLLMLTPAIQAFGPPREIVPSLYKVVATIRADSSDDEDGRIPNALRLLAQVAALLEEPKLADAVAEACIERLAIREDRENIIETIHRLIECSAAEQDRELSRVSLARRLEQLGYIVRNGALLAEIADWIDELKIVNPTVKCSLGRALAIARLGATRSAPAQNTEVDRITSPAPAGFSS
jgi:hypothetical protein